MGKYKFKLDARVKGIVEWRLTRYREDKRELEAAVERLMPSPTPSYSLNSGGSGNAGRRTEEQAFKILSSPYLMQMEHDCKAIDRAMQRFDQTDMQLIELVYWRQEYSIAGAGQVIGLAKSSAYQRVNIILSTIAVEMGLVCA